MEGEGGKGILLVRSENSGAGKSQYPKASLLTSGVAALPAVPRTALPLQPRHDFVFDSVRLLCARLGPEKQEHSKPVFSDQTGVGRYIYNYIMLSYESNVPFH